MIPNNGGIQALSHFFDQLAKKGPPTHTLTRLAELVLTLNAFSFNGEYYRQVAGVAMGSKMGPSYACLYVGFIEEQIRASYTGFHSCSNVTLMTLLDARSALATIWSSKSITYLTSTQLSSSHQPSANWNCRFLISN